MENPKRYLFVCRFNTDRSPAGVDVFKSMMSERGFSVGDLESEVAADFYVGSAGTEVDLLEIRDAIQYTPELGQKVDLIFAANRLIEEELVKLFSTPQEKIKDLEIPNAYNIFLPDDLFALKNLLRENLAEYIPEKKK